MVVRVATFGWFVSAVVVSVAAGFPDRLPAIALGSCVVLAAERVAALMIVFVVVAVIIDRGQRGDLPIEFRGVKYADREATDQLAQKTSQAIVALADSVDDLAMRLDAVERRV